MANANNTGFRRLVNATLFSIAGLRAAWRNEAAFRQECALAAVLTPAAFWVGQTAVQRSLLIGTCWLVLVVELLNSAIEAVVDRVGTDHHKLSGRAKDLGSAAVFVSLALTALVWGLALWERFA
jgi:diacylglycerol kinase (ATP)